MRHDIADMNMNMRSSWNNLETIQISVKGVRANYSRLNYGRMGHPGLSGSFSKSRPLIWLGYGLVRIKEQTS